MGFDSGRIIGLGTCVLISFTTDSVKAFGCVLVPIRTWGFIARTRDVKSFVSTEVKSESAQA